MTGTTQRPPVPRRQVLSVAVLGLVAGAGFVVPGLAYRVSPPGQPRTAALVVAASVAILLVRLAGRRLRSVLDATDGRWRIPLLCFYCLVAMGAVVLVLLR